ncbi:hypothetical protein [Dyadobacter pollutisoli]|jgi:hypothetical protein|uniref:Uncharacterized protein n=1 Tax=Dyadobacter pollutisoli TaxID=2910158 RepID=A0A9E8NAG9_9BACT|nr:hypothetical protein [Dyadobacter pollutisoli]WAC12353.1 hypothetical protein ON006_00020 [Dyadobacter pollutisoli]
MRKTTPKCRKIKDATKTTDDESLWRLPNSCREEVNIVASGTKKDHPYETVFEMVLWRLPTRPDLLYQV